MCRPTLKFVLNFLVANLGYHACSNQNQVAQFQEYPACMGLYWDTTKSYMYCVIIHVMLFVIICTYLDFVNTGNSLQSLYIGQGFPFLHLTSSVDRHLLKQVYYIMNSVRLDQCCPQRFLVHLVITLHAIEKVQYTLTDNIFI